MIYRFQDQYSGVNLDYILFFNKDRLEVSTQALIRINIQHEFSNEFKIIDNQIDWSAVDSEVITLKCQDFCNKVLKLIVFG